MRTKSCCCFSLKTGTYIIGMSLMNALQEAISEDKMIPKGLLCSLATLSFAVLQCKDTAWRRMLFFFAFTLSMIADIYQRYYLDT